MSKIRRKVFFMDLSEGNKGSSPNDNYTVNYPIPIKAFVYEANCPQCDIRLNTDNKDYRFCPKCGRVIWNQK